MDCLLVDFQNIGCGGFGVLSLASSLNSKGYSCSVVGSTSIIEILKDEERFMRTLIEERPMIVGLSVMTQYADHINHVTSLIRSALGSVPILLGGYHASTFRGDVFSIHSDVDYVFAGDADVSLPSFLKSYFEGSVVDGPGVLSRSQWAKGGRVVVSVVDDVDGLPFYDESLIHENYSEIARYGHPSIPSPSRYVLFSRGCPFKCSFCAMQDDGGFRSKVRMYSPSKVIDNLSDMVESMGLKGVSFLDDNFCLRKSWAHEVCDGIRSMGLGIKWQAQVRADLADKDLFKNMYDSGCRVAIITIESGNDRIRNDVMNKKTTRRQIEAAYDMARDVGMLIQGTLMLGSPTERAEECIDSIDFFRKMDPDWAGVLLTTLLPGTCLFEKYAKDWKYGSFSDFDIFNTEKRYEMGARDGVFHRMEDDFLLNRLRELRAEYDYTTRKQDRARNLRRMATRNWMEGIWA
ncbi:MAG: B12-binding domain-containing radical SAM protein [Thermodesulfobacteriota bacterium]